MLSRRFCSMIWEERLYGCVDGKTCDGAELKSRVEHAADNANQGMACQVKCTVDHRGCSPRVLGRHGHEKGIVRGDEYHGDAWKGSISGRNLKQDRNLPMLPMKKPVATNFQ